MTQPTTRQGEASVPVAVALGTNLGDRRRNLAFARHRIAELLTDLVCSSVYETEPRHLHSQPRFLNACCTGRTTLAPDELIARFQSIERATGRGPGGERYGPRPLDIDLLLYGHRIIQEEGLVVPHPRMPERGFVLIPLAEIAPNWVHPVLGETVKELRDRVSVDAGVSRYEEAECRETDAESPGG